MRDGAAADAGTEQLTSVDAPPLKLHDPHHLAVAKPADLLKRTNRARQPSFVRQMQLGAQIRTIVARRVRFVRINRFRDRHPPQSPLSQAQNRAPPDKRAGLATPPLQR